MKKIHNSESFVSEEYVIRIFKFQPVVIAITPIFSLEQICALKIRKEDIL